jgi:voltage-gated potassium channel
VSDPLLGLGLLLTLALAALALRRLVGKQRLALIIFEADTPAGRGFDLALLAAIVLSVLLVALESDPALRALHPTLFNSAELFFTVLFSFEYLLRLLCSPTPWRYARSFFGIVDLISSLPPLVAIGMPAGRSLLIVRVLRLLRVFRILKLGTYLKEAELLGQALQASSRKITVFLLTIVALVVLIGTLMHVIEGPESGFSSIPVGIYWAIVTITTVGYGDVAPITPLGRCLASVVMLLGYSILAVPTGIVSASLQQMRRLPPNEAAGGSNGSCPHCGKQLPRP